MLTASCRSPAQRERARFKVPATRVDRREQHMSDFGLPKRGRNTEYWLQQANVFRMQLLGGAGADHIMQSIANDVGAWMPRLENALAADNMVQYKGFLEGLLGRVVDLEQQMLQQPAPNAAKVATARQLVDALQKSYASL
jgi:hypothetical protein